MNPIYAIGDIHGRDHLFEKMYARIEYDPDRSDDKIQWKLMRKSNGVL